MLQVDKANKFSLVFCDGTSIMMIVRVLVVCGGILEILGQLKNCFNALVLHLLLEKMA